MSFHLPIQYHVKGNRYEIDCNGAAIKATVKFDDGLPSVLWQPVEDRSFSMEEYDCVMAAFWDAEDQILTEAVDRRYFAAPSKRGRPFLVCSYQPGAR